ncbi:MFS transporter [Streptomyces stramineus]
MGVYTLGAGLSVAVGPLIGTVTYGSFGFQGLVWIYAALLLLNAALCLRVTSPGDGMPVLPGAGTRKVPRGDGAKDASPEGGAKDAPRGGEAKTEARRGPGAARATGAGQATAVCAAEPSA